MTRALLLLALVTGCAHQYGGRATVLDHGQAQLTPMVELDLATVRGDETHEAVNLPWLQVGMGYHHGIGGRFEAGFRMFGAGIPGSTGEFGVAIDTKLQLFKSDDRESGWDLSIAASPSYHFGVQGQQPFHLFGVAVSLLLGKNFGRHQLVFGLRFADYLLTSYGARPVNTVWGGASVGLSLRVKRVEIFPELALMYSPVTFGGERVDEQRKGLTYVSLGLSVPINLGP